MRVVTTTLGELRCRIVEGGAGATPPELALVLCHGFGAGGEDLVGLAAELVQRSPNLESKVRFVFPEAPLELSGIGYFGARAWWMIDVERYARALSEQDVAALRRQVPEGLPRARRMLMALVDELSRTSALLPGQIVLGGFSQGGMLATDVALRMEEPPAALCVYSGTLVCEDEWRQRAGARSGLRVLQSHGRSDPLLPYDNAIALRDLLIEGGLAVEFLPFPGQHTIPAEAVDALARLLSEALAART
jgi:phospholipase/carboxylesterase